MTRERDRIQENANKYIVKNCPALQQTYYCDTHHSKCQDCTDCVIKQVIEKCKKTLDLMNSASGNNAYAGGRCTEAEQILQLFDMEEINK